MIKKLVIVDAIVLVVVLFKVFGFDQYLTQTNLRLMKQKGNIRTSRRKNR